MKKCYFISYLLFFLFSANAQHWIWSKNIYTAEVPGQFGPDHTFTDNQGRLYAYTSAYNVNGYWNNAINGTMGTILYCYSNNGDLLFKKHWQFPFYIQYMEYDGVQSCYFSAIFLGNITIDGITIQSMGSEDGVTGKMDLNGTILWMKTFGGLNKDNCIGITYNKIANIVCSTGSISDSLFLDNVFHSSNKQSAIVMQYDANGNSIRVKLFDFMPERETYWPNSGREVQTDNLGNYFFLMDKEGQNWSGDTLTAPEEGRYVVKTNANLDTLWTKYIIGPACYYGMSGHTLRVAPNGDAYVISNCSSKYGGEARISRLNAQSGSVVWQQLNDDGFYTDLKFDDGKLYAVGMEGAYACPCEEGHGGYGVIKIYDAQNSILGETRVSSLIGTISIDPQKNIFVTGKIGNEPVAIGPDTLYPDTATFLSKLGPQMCSVVDITSTANNPHWRTYEICPGGAAVLNASGAGGTFTWTNGATGNSTSVSIENFYSVINQQPGGCIAYSLPVKVNINTNVQSHRFCMVSYNNNSGRNKLYVISDDWTESQDVATIIVYRGEETNLVPFIQFQNQHDVITAIMDSLSQPDSHAYYYAISTTDTCGTQSAVSPMQRTMLLNVSVDNDNTILNWSAYEGKEVLYYRIYRGASKETLALYDSSMMQTAYTDFNSDAQDYFYQVEAVLKFWCYTGSFGLQHPLSNIVSNQVTAVASQKKEFNLNIYPNPVDGIVNIEIENNTYAGNLIELKLVNALSDVVLKESRNINSESAAIMTDLSQFAAGVYFLSVSDGEYSTTRKIILQPKE